MRSVVWSMGVSLDGYIADRDGRFDWSAPDEELHRFHNERAREAGAQVYGRRLYETMRAWETIEDGSDAMGEFARIWRATPKYVASRTLDRVGDGYTLVRDAAEAVADLKQRPGGHIDVGGAGLAASLIERGLVDEFALFLSPIAVGGGTPFFPPAVLPLRLLESRTFASGVVYVRYELR